MHSVGPGAISGPYNSDDAARKNPKFERLLGHGCSDPIQFLRIFRRPPRFYSFFTIPESLSESEFKTLGLLRFLFKLNDACEASFKNCLVRLLEQSGEIVCVIYDEFMHFSETAAKCLKIPSIIFTTSNAATWVCRSVLGKSKARFLSPLKDPGSQQKLVQEFHPLRFKDLPTSAFGPVEDSLQLFENSGNERTSSAIILNTVRCLESSSLGLLRQECQIPIFPVGPLHLKASTSPSLLEEDMSGIEWLDKQGPSSVIYVSFGSLALMQKNELDEMAWGLADSKQPFLWVIRPGSIPGSEWIESLPGGSVLTVGERGCLVKWAPQKKVLAHRAVGGFWSHCGWNSMLGSISEGVPMICRPFSGDQKVNARVSSCVWGLGFQVEGELKRGVVERAVRRLLVDPEGEETRKKALELKGLVKASVANGGSSCNSLDELVNFITQF